MPRTSSGTYQKPAGTTAVTATTVQSAPYNTLMDDMASALTGSLPVDGSKAMGAALPMGGFKITGMATGTADTDAATTAQVNAISSGVVESGSIMLFQQTAAPSGWTKLTTHNDKAIRIVSGTAASGGSTAFTSIFAARTIATVNLPSHTHTFSATTSSDGAHTHTVTGCAEDDNSVENGSNGNAGFEATKTTSSNGAHTHTISGTSAATGSGTAMDFAVQYVDVILASKN